MDDMSVLHDALVVALAFAVALSLFTSIGFAPADAVQVHAARNTPAIVQRIPRPASNAANRSQPTQSLPALAAAAIVVVAVMGRVRDRHMYARDVVRNLSAAPRGPPAAALAR